VCSTGNKFVAPDWFIADLPKTPLDGELWCGRGLFQKTLSIVKKTKDPAKYADDWKFVTYLVFDAPALKKPYEDRVKYLHEVIKADTQSTYAAVVGIRKCEGLDHLMKLQNEVLRKGGEGIMLRKPGSMYENKRSHSLLKVKTFHDEEAKCTGWEKGSGRCSNMMGKLHCVLPNGIVFKIGTGFSDFQRKNPPSAGTILTFKFQEVSNTGHPRFPVFLHERPELTWADVVQNAKTKPPFSQLKKIVSPLLQKQHTILWSTVPSRDASGQKIVTDDDIASDEEDDGSEKKSKSKAKGAKKKQTPCRYGELCYRTNSAHRTQFSHPAKKRRG